MNEDQEKKEIREKVMSAIESGQVKMRPKWHFILKSTLFILGIFIALLLVLYLVSFTAFSVHQTGLDLAPAFGSRGWFDFLRYFPWLLVFLCLAFMVILEVLVKKFSFAYRKPLLYSALGVILITSLGGIAVAQTSFHRGFAHFVRLNRLPFAPAFYEHFEFPNQYDDIHRGTVVANTQDGFVLQLYDDGTSTVLISSSTQLPTQTQFVTGDQVVVFGEETTSGISAFGIRTAVAPCCLGPGY